METGKTDMSLTYNTDFCCMGEHDEWGYVHHEVRGDGEPRYKILQERKD